MLNTCKVFSTAVVLASIAAAEASPPSQASERSRAGGPAPVRLAQLSAPDLVLRIDRLEEEIRRLTGLVEQLQYRNQQLEQQLRRAQGVPGPGIPADVQARSREPDARGAVAGMTMPAAPTAVEPQPVPSATAPSANSAPSAPSPGRRDVFDPIQNPTAPGAPRTLGTLSEAAARPAAPAPDRRPTS